MFKLIIPYVALMLYGDITSAAETWRSVQGLIECSNEFTATVVLVDRDRFMNDQMGIQTNDQLTVERRGDIVVKHYYVAGSGHDGWPSREVGKEDVFVDIYHDCNVPVGDNRRRVRLYLHEYGIAINHNSFYFVSIKLDADVGVEE